MPLPIEYAQVDRLNLAYQVAGAGPLDIVLVAEWSTPLEGRWDVSAIARPLQRLGSFARVISFDKGGTGLSDGSFQTDEATPEFWVRDLVAVLDAVGSARPVVFGAHEGGPIALLYAASLPERTEAVVLVNTGPRLLRAADYPFGSSEDSWRPDIAGIRATWQSGSAAEVHIAAARHDPWWREWYARARRSQVSPAGGLALLRMIGELDVRSILSAVHAPTLVLHRTNNAWWPVEGARWLAGQLAHGEFVELPGEDNLWWAGDSDRVVDEVERFLLGERTSQPSQRQLVTIMFTDLVDSTRQVAAIGDRAWRRVLDDHDAATRARTERFGGTVVKQLGDGFLLRFPGPTVAIHAAQDLQAELVKLGLHLRIAVHTGEAEVRGDDLSGVAVHLCARMLTVASPDGIVVTGVVKGLVAGSALRFEDLGRRRLKGIPDEWDLYLVQAPAS